LVVNRSTKYEPMAMIELPFASNINGIRCAARKLPRPDRAGAFVDILQPGKKWF
jgi:hypothetical protein